MFRRREKKGERSRTLAPKHSGANSRTRGLRWFLLGGAVTALFGAAALWLVYANLEYTPGEIIRYAKRRLAGHPTLERVTLPVLDAWRGQVERPVPGRLPSLGKGQQPGGLQRQMFRQNGQPLPSAPISESDDYHGPASMQLLGSMRDIERAFQSAQPGDVLEILPGTYAMNAAIRMARGGLRDNPITVTAKVPGSVVIESTALEGFYLAAPFWIFENLVIRGKCHEHGDCEHAFHIVGKARGTVIRNNRIEDFNAQIKVNGLNGDFPDNGLVQYNTLTNTAVRNTANPVTPIDIVAASHWQVLDNRISNYIKGDGNRISYAVFMKGGGSHGRIERNLIIGTEGDISQPGIRVGLSFGGGGTDAHVCRDRRCIAEHTAGVAANNIVVHCNDFGVYVNSSNQSLIAYNTLINTAGIDVRFPGASAVVYGNLVDGLVRSRDGALVDQSMNVHGRVKSLFADADLLNLAFRTTPVETSTHDMITSDFCARPRGRQSLPGALASDLPCRN